MNDHPKPWNIAFNGTVANPIDANGRTMPWEMMLDAANRPAGPAGEVELLFTEIGVYIDSGERDPCGAGNRVIKVKDEQAKLLIDALKHYHAARKAAQPEAGAEREPYGWYDPASMVLFLDKETAEQNTTCLEGELVALYATERS